jgi:hypothetical protein
MTLMRVRNLLLVNPLFVTTTNGLF